MMRAHELRAQPSTMTLSSLTVFSKGSSTYELPEESKYDFSGPLKREVRVTKEEGEWFGVKLCEIEGRLFVIHVQDRHTCNAKRFTPGARCGLEWGDELLSVGLTMARGKDPRDLERLLDVGSRVHLEFLQSPFTHRITTRCNRLISSEITYFSSEIIAVRPGTQAAAAGLIPGHTIVEVAGENLLGLPDRDVLWSLDEAQFWVGRGDLEICTMPSHMAVRFAAAFKQYLAVRASESDKTVVVKVTSGPALAPKTTSQNKLGRRISLHKFVSSLLPVCGKRRASKTVV
eukprot:comp36763_c0_seq1/m.47329 comp36763_c0_seq1/g.47329  ORF comp36763_c0_seq1/g.47329 comp36763_c0_seq1/m.47329 type:complete len:288 (-) comp36763_c0_seq1:244-1107(-)